MKFVLNKCYGGFGLSQKAASLLNSDIYDYDDYDKRSDEKLISVVSELGDEASGGLAALSVVEIPDTATDYEIRDYDGFESITYVVRGKLHHA